MADDAALSAHEKAQDARLDRIERKLGLPPLPAPGTPPAPPVAPPVVTPPAPPVVTPPAPGVVVALVNESTLVTDGQVAAWGAALAIQAAHVDGHWHTGVATVVGPVKSSAVPAGAIPLVMLDNADQAGALGYHDVDPHGRPYGRVFVHDCETDGVAPSSCASHEFVEIVGDPPCDLWEPGVNGGPQLARELGDPVETTSYWITPDGHPTIEVSDFVTPAYFGLAAPDIPITAEDAQTVVLSHTGLSGPPGKPLAGGYQITRDAHSGVVSQVFGDAYPHGRLADAKAWPSARTARRLAVSLAEVDA